MRNVWLLFFIALLIIVESKKNNTIADNFSILRSTSTCVELTCNNGRCIETTQGANCICDEGFIGTNCNQQASDFYRRTQLIPGLADPDILAINDDLFYLTGTSNAMSLPIFQSTDLINFHLKITYDPSISDSMYNYCFIWAPDLSKRDGGYDLYFSAQRVSKGAPCPANGQDVTTFFARASDDNLIFSTPVLVDFGIGAPKGRIAAGCNSDGCLKTVRIDSAVVGPENNRWTQLPLYQYSVDVVKKDGSSVGPCISVVRIGATLETTYVGICPDSGNQLVDKGDIAAFRLFYSRNNIWRDFVE
ncbi:unnamed protein product, partial [Rotaria sordida]